MDRKLFIKKPKLSIRDINKENKVEVDKATYFMDIKSAKKYGKITKKIDE